MSESMRSKRDGWLRALCTGSTLAIGAIVAAIVIDIFVRGAASLHPHYLIDRVLDAGRDGGIGPVLLSTFWILGVCLSVVVPLGLTAATYLSEGSRRHPRYARWTRRNLDVLASTPSIAFGLFGNAFFSEWLGLGFSILAGGLTLACMTLPIFVHAAEQSLRDVPHEIAQGAAALGLRPMSRFIHLTLPSALPGILAGLVLSIGRALAETAALIFTSGYVVRPPTSWFDSGRSLSVHIYELALNVPGADQPAASAAVVLLALLVAIHLSAHWLSTRWAPRRLAS